MGEKMGKDIPKCVDCALRKKAEEKPRSFLAILWKLHTYVCPGWKSYQRYLAQGGPQA
jgi:hypothetical protein